MDLAERMGDSIRLRPAYPVLGPNQQVLRKRLDLWVIGRDVTELNLPLTFARPERSRR